MPARLGAPLAVLAVAGAWALLARPLPLRGPEGPGPAFVPLLLAGLLGVLALLLLVQAVLGGAPPPAGPGWRPAALVVLPMALYILALAHVGFAPATLAYVALAAWQCGGRSPRVLAGTAVGIALAVWIVLAVLFKVPLK